MTRVIFLTDWTNQPEPTDSKPFMFFFSALDEIWYVNNYQANKAQQANDAFMGIISTLSILSILSTLSTFSTPSTFSNVNVGLPR